MERPFESTTPFYTFQLLWDRLITIIHDENATKVELDVVAFLLCLKQITQRRSSLPSRGQCIHLNWFAHHLTLICWTSAFGNLGSVCVLCVGFVLCAVCVVCVGCMLAVCVVLDVSRKEEETKKEKHKNANI